MLDPLQRRAGQGLRTQHPRQARLVIGAALVALLGLFAVLCDPRGVRQLRKLSAELDRQRAANSQLEREKAELEAAVKALAAGTGPAAERAVREQLGWVREDELVFKFE